MVRPDTLAGRTIPIALVEDDFRVGHLGLLSSLLDQLHCAVMPFPVLLAVVCSVAVCQDSLEEQAQAECKGDCAHGVSWS